MKKRKTKNVSLLKAPESKKRMYRTQMTINGVKWDFHKYDDDFNPSVPHGHSIDRKYTLRLWDGMIFNVRTGAAEGYAKANEIKKLYNDSKLRKLVEESRTWYLEKHGFCPELIPYVDCKANSNAVAQVKTIVSNIQYKAEVPNIQFKAKVNNVRVAHNQSRTVDETYRVKLSCCFVKRKNRRGFYGRTKPETNNR